jgi:DNA-binding transcriptional MerR regulator
MKSIDFSEMSFKIGEVAAMFDISTKTLRLYDRLGLLKPNYIDKESGYRYYNAEQISCLEIILNFKKLGFSLKDISYFLNVDINNNDLLTKFQNKQLELQNEINTAQYNIELIEGIMQDLNQGSLTHRQLTEQQRALLLSRITCLENTPLEESLAQILWL